MINKFFYALSAIAFVGVVYLMTILFYWAIFPQNIVSYPKGTTFQTVGTKIKAGSYIQYTIYYCKYTQDVSTVYITLVGKNVYTLPATRRNIPPGCHYYTISDTYIPPIVTPGTYRLHITVEYKPNPIRTVQYFVETNSFQVIN